MRPIVLILSIILGFQIAQAQFGVRMKYGSLSPESLPVMTEVYEWAQQPGFRDQRSLTAIEVGLEYWWKPMERRLEIMPELIYGWHETLTPDLSQGSPISSESYNASILINVRAYPMDFNSDCDCPTFSKDGNFFTKGFYVELGPGVHYTKHEALTPTIQVPVHNSSNTSWRVHAGVGLDIGLSNLITLNPFFSYNWIGKDDRVQIASQLDPRVDPIYEAGATASFVGLRVAFRPDYKPYGRRR